MRILANNIGDTAVLTASPAMVTTLPETNLQSQYRETVARWTALDGQAICATWGRAQPVNMVCLYRTNFSSSATWRVRMFSDPVYTTSVYDSGYVTTNNPVPLGSLDWGVDPLGLSLYSYWDYAVCRLYFTSVLAQSMQIDVIDVANEAGYAQASRLFVGQYLEPSSGPVLGMTVGYRENTTQTRTEGGSLRTDPGANWRVLNVTMQQMEDDDRRQFMEILRRYGMRGDLFVSVHPDTGDELERDHELQAKLTNLSDISNPYQIRYDHTLQFGEL